MGDARLTFSPRARLFWGVLCLLFLWVIKVRLFPFNLLNAGDFDGKIKGALCSLLKGCFVQLCLLFGWGKGLTNFMDTNFLPCVFSLRS